MEIVDILKKSTNLEFHSVQGGHHFHLDNPAPVGLIVNDFLNKD